VSEPWVVNASPVIVLARAGYLHLLKELPAELLLREAVLSGFREPTSRRLSVLECWHNPGHYVSPSSGRARARLLH